MNTVVIFVDPQWSKRYFDALSPHYEFTLRTDNPNQTFERAWHGIAAAREDLVGEGLESLEHAYNAAAMYVFWRSRTDARGANPEDRRVSADNQNLQRIVADIIHGQQIFLHDPTVLVRLWEDLYDTVHSSLLDIQRKASIHSIRFEVDRVPPCALVVNCVFQ